MIVSLNIFIQQSESIGQQGKPYLKAFGSEMFTVLHIDKTITKR